MDKRVHVGQLHMLPEVRNQATLPARITLNEISLREEVIFPARLTMDQKMALARALDAAGVPQVEVQTPDAAEIVRRSRDEKLRFKIQAIVRPFFPDRYPDWQSEIDAAVASGTDKICMVTRTSDNQIVDLGLSREALLSKVPSYVRYARDKGARELVCTFADSTRADPGFLEQLAKACVSAGATGIHIADTIGVMNPTAMKHFIRMVRSWVDVPIGVHCHNDMGLGLANALASLEAGAEVVDVAVNGTDPERIGLAAFEELVTVLYCLYQRDLGIDMNKLYELSRLFADQTGVPISIYKPVVGDNAFAQKRELTLQAARRNPALFEAFEPELVGNRRWVSLGTGSGPGAIRAKMEELGLRITEAAIPVLVEQVNVLASDKRAPLSDAEFRELASASAT